MADCLASPIIVIGMHRSGTTLLTRMLEAFGVHWGEKRDEYNEALNFQSINESIFERASATWDNPLPVSESLNRPSFVEEALRLAEERLGGDWIRSHHRSSTMRGAEMTAVGGAPWGWKDPRTTFTLPLWLRLYPRAQVVHVIRHGTDVAISLFSRETTRPEGRFHPHFSERCQTLEGCFSLWKTYVTQGRSYMDIVGRMVEVRFEKLLSDTSEELNRLCFFLDIPSSSFRKGCFPDIRLDRRFAYRRNKDPKVNEFIRKAASDPLLAAIDGQMARET